MADTLDILTLTEGKTAANITTSDHDTELAQHITAVSRLIDAEVGPVVVRTITDELHDGGYDSIDLRFSPVSSITTVTEYNAGVAQVLTAETVTSLIANSYSAESFGSDPSLLSGCIVRRESGGDYRFPPGRRNVKVTYVAGRYANTAAVDARFKACAASVLRRLWKRESGTWAQSSSFFENADQGADSIGFFRVAKPIIDEMLRDHRPVSVG